jgi:fimbrial chaperone protein
MRRIFCIALLTLLPHTAQAQTAALDVAPTSLDLKPGAAGIFYITNHGGAPVAVQIEAQDWRQTEGADVITPSNSLFTSPPLARISPGTRQSVRVLARPAGGGSETSYRLRVSQLPDPAQQTDGVAVLLQFSVPVFVADAKTSAAPALVWDAQDTPDGVSVSVRNSGPRAVKLTGLMLNGAKLGNDAFVYVLPGASHRFAAAAAKGPLRLTGRDERSGRTLSVDLPVHS